MPAISAMCRPVSRQRQATSCPSITTCTGDHLHALEGSVHALGSPDNALTKVRCREPLEGFHVAGLYRMRPGLDQAADLVPRHR